MTVGQIVGAPAIQTAVQFDTTFTPPSEHSEGLIYWDAASGTFSMMTDVDDVVLQIGQEQYAKVHNNNGDTILNGTALYLTGAVVGGIPAIAKAIANDYGKSLVLGVATADIDDGEQGYCTTFGLVRDIDTSSFAAGDQLWLSAAVAGLLVTDEPAPPNLSQQVGMCLISDVDVGVLLVSPNISQNVPQTITFTLPLRAVTDDVLNITGEFREVAAGETGDYATDFAVSNHHVYLYINSLTGSGDVTITGTSIDEADGTPAAADTETITVDTASVFYQSAKKWWEITNIDIPAGITVVDYDIGVVGYSDINNQDFELLAYRVDAFSQGAAPDFRFRIIKVQDDGSKQMSLVDLEDIGVDSGEAGDQIIDGVRTGGNDRSYDPVVADIWGNDTTLVFKQGDFSDYFTSDENLCYSGSLAEGIILRIEGSPTAGVTNVDFITIQLRYRPI